MNNKDSNTKQDEAQDVASDITPQEEELLDNAGTNSTDNEDLQRTQLDSMDEEGVLLNEGSSATNIAGGDLDVPGSELDDADEINIKLAEEVSFLNKAAIKKTLKNIKPNSQVCIDARSTSYIATDILEMIQEFANIRAKEEDIEVRLIGFKTSYQEYADDEDSHIIIAHTRAM